MGFLTSLRFSCAAILVARERSLQGECSLLANSNRDCSNRMLGRAGGGTCGHSMPLRTPPLSERAPSKAGSAQASVPDVWVEARSHPHSWGTPTPAPPQHTPYRTCTQKCRSPPSVDSGGRSRSQHSQLGLRANTRILSSSNDEIRMLRLTDLRFCCGPRWVSSTVRANRSPHPRQQQPLGRWRRRALKAPAAPRFLPREALAPTCRL